MGPADAVAPLVCARRLVQQQRGGLTIHSSCPQFACAARGQGGDVRTSGDTSLAPIRDARGYDDVAAAAAEALLIMDWIIRKFCLNLPDRISGNTHRVQLMRHDP